jgi:2-amino-4-hydroxy-6-hydroxymethyldihydropteridine diphosphokinase
MAWERCNMIFLGLGGNLHSSRFGEPRATLEAALGDLDAQSIRVCRRSQWYRSQPVPDDGQPWYVNGVAELETALSPPELLARLLQLEHRYGRVRRERWAPRVIDLDLLAYHELSNWENRAGAAPVLPHPRLHERASVQVPLAELAPGWLHPALHRTVEELLQSLPPGQFVAAEATGSEPPAGGAVAGAAPTR